MYVLLMFLELSEASVVQALDILYTTNNTQQRQLSQNQLIRLYNFHDKLDKDIEKILSLAWKLFCNKLYPSYVRFYGISTIYSYLEWILPNWSKYKYQHIIDDIMNWLLENHKDFTNTNDIVASKSQRCLALWIACNIISEKCIDDHENSKYIANIPRDLSLYVANALGEEFKNISHNSSHGIALSSYFQRHFDSVSRNLLDTSITENGSSLWLETISEWVCFIGITSSTKFCWYELLMKTLKKQNTECYFDAFCDLWIKIFEVIDETEFLGKFITLLISWMTEEFQLFVSFIKHQENQQKHSCKDEHFGCKLFKFTKLATKIIHTFQYNNELLGLIHNLTLVHCKYHQISYISFSCYIHIQQMYQFWMDYYSTCQSIFISCPDIINNDLWISLFETLIKYTAIPETDEETMLECKNLRKTAKEELYPIFTRILSSNIVLDHLCSSLDLNPSNESLWFALASTLTEHIDSNIHIGPELCERLYSGSINFLEFIVNNDISNKNLLLETILFLLRNLIPLFSYYDRVLLFPQGLFTVLDNIFTFNSPSLFDSRLEGAKLLKFLPYNCDMWLSNAILSLSCAIEKHLPTINTPLNENDISTLFSSCTEMIETSIVHQLMNAVINNCSMDSLLSCILRAPKDNHDHSMLLRSILMNIYGKCTEELSINFTELWFLHDISSISDTSNPFCYLLWREGHDLLKLYVAHNKDSNIIEWIFVISKYHSQPLYLACTVSLMVKIVEHYDLDTSVVSHWMTFSIHHLHSQNSPELISQLIELLKVLFEHSFSPLILPKYDIFEWIFPLLSNTTAQVECAIYKYLKVYNSTICMNSCFPPEYESILKRLLCIIISRLELSSENVLELSSELLFSYKQTHPRLFFSAVMNGLGISASQLAAIKSPLALRNYIYKMKK